MRFDKKDLLLYAVTDRSWLNGKTLPQQVEEALLGGVTMLQLREKALNEAVFLEEALALKALCARYGVPFLLNDNVPLAVRCGADGVHVGQTDMAAAEVRRMLGPDKILGVSVQTAAQAKQAQAAGADYIGVGAVFSTSTKPEADVVSFHTLQQICASVAIPAVAIGGIGETNLPALSGSGIAGVAVVSAIFAAPAPEAAAHRLLLLAKQAVQSEKNG